MNDTRNLYGADPASLAPSVDRRWIETFVVEQRLLDVPGQRIGDALATIESHVQESGESAQEAFGDPREYARAMADADGNPGRSPVGPLAVAHIVLGLAGLHLVARAFSSWLIAAPVQVLVGDLVVAAVLAVLVGVLLAAPSTVLRLLVERRWLALVLPLVLIGGFVAILLLWREPVVELSTLLTGVVGLVLLVTSSILAAVDRSEDRITAPGEAPRRTTAGRWTSVLLMPALTLLLMGLSWVTHLLS
ncbi:MULTISPECIES: HAAS signaling domain-containing protein [unclassified Ornithinimicrobium]|uniref:HAAS signaling domain-containing protein n=1 Tax=unclassified Ornithinimicrobium TaxID=2615080 RepID=UPI0038524406